MQAPVPPPTHRRRAELVAMVALALTASAAGHPTQHSTQAGHALGMVSFPVSCSAEAQAEFNDAVALLHHMTYPQAQTAFARVAALDPGCAMAHWGIAMTLFQPLWPTRPGPDALQRGWQAVQDARSRPLQTSRERLFIEAAAAFFVEPQSTDYWRRIERWEQAMATVFASFPDDPEAPAFYALAHLATTPVTTESREHADRAAAILQRVYASHPDHPGAMHYLVHANDVPGRERELLEVTRKYETVAPRNPHALHMPTHIYTRLGDWEGVIRGNLPAAEAALEHSAGAQAEWVWDEFPHAIEYLVYAYLQQGDDERAAGQLRRLRSTPRLEPTFKTAFHLASKRARDVLERRAWREAMALAPREPATLDWDRFTWPEAVVHFARGLGAARLGELQPAHEAVERLEQLELATREAGEVLFARNIQMLGLELQGWVAHAQGQRDASRARLREAAALEASTPKHAVTPGPTLPALELLGDLLTEQGEHAGALEAYTRSLERYPQRFNSLLGAARAARAAGDDSIARTRYRDLLDVAAGGTRTAALDEARSYLSSATLPATPRR